MLSWELANLTDLQLALDNHQNQSDWFGAMLFRSKVHMNQKKLSLTRLFDIKHMRLISTILINIYHQTIYKRRLFFSD